MAVGAETLRGCVRPGMEAEFDARMADVLVPPADHVLSKFHSVTPGRVKLESVNHVYIGVSSKQSILVAAGGKLKRTAKGISQNALNMELVQLASYFDCVAGLYNEPRLAVLTGFRGLPHAPSQLATYRATRSCLRLLNVKCFYCSERVHAVSRELLADETVPKFSCTPLDWASTWKAIVQLVRQLGHLPADIGHSLMETNSL